MSQDVAADITSLNSLSFAGMVCIQNQHSMPQKEHVQQLAQDDKASSFKFGHAVPKKTYLDDISNGQLLKQAVGLPRNLSQTGYQTSSKRQDESSNGTSDITESCGDTCTRKPNTRVKIAADKKRTNSGFNHKIFKSFTTPCRDCRAIEPTASLKNPPLQ